MASVKWKCGFSLDLCSRGSPVDRSVAFHQVAANEWDESGRVSLVKYCSPQQSSCLRVWQHPPPRPLHHYLSSHYQLPSSETSCTLYAFHGECGCTCRGLDLLCVCVPHVRKREVMLKRQVATEASRYPFCVIVVISPWQLCVCVCGLLSSYQGHNKDVGALEQWSTHAGTLGLNPAYKMYCISYLFPKENVFSTIFVE